MKLKNAPNVSKQPKGKPFEAYIIAGSDAWNKTRWQTLKEWTKAEADYLPIVLGPRELNNLAGLKLAVEVGKISIFMAGEIKEAEKSAICQNLATHSTAENVAFFNEALQLKENASEYIAHLRAEMPDKPLEMEEPIKNTPYIEKRLEGDLEGLYLVTPKYEQGELISEKLDRLSDVINVIGLGVNENEHEHFLLLQDENKPLILPMEDVGELKGWQFLKRHGLTITSKTRLKAELADWLQLQGKKAKRYTITNKTGWHDDFNAFVLPNGDVIGEASTPIKYHALDRATGYDTQGTAEEWRSNVGNLAYQNPSMMLAVGVALSAPLLKVLGLDAYGVHLFEDSTHGKTTTLNVASSIYGKPKETATSWNATPYALQNIASGRNDLFMPLDEISESTPKSVNQTAYSLFNGQGKLQGAKEGGNREVKRWLISNLSTGETDLESYLKANGITANSGQFVRLLNLPMRKASHFHQYPDGKAHADALNANTRQFYGTIGREWLAYLIATDKAEIRAIYEKIKAYRLAMLPDDCEGQIKRVVSDRFSVIHTALFLASELLNWEDSEINTALNACFNDWVSVNGWHSKKEAQIIEQVNGFLLANSESGFILFPFDERQGRINNVLGYKVLGDDKQPEHFYLYPIAFDEAIKGQSKEIACKILVSAKMLEEGNEKGSRYKIRIPKRIDPSRQRAYKMHLLREEDE